MMVLIESAQGIASTRGLPSILLAASMDAASITMNDVPFPGSSALSDGAVKSSSGPFQRCKHHDPLMGVPLGCYLYSYQEWWSLC
jgi:hypothetical protein